MHTRFWWGSLREGIGRRWEDNIKRDLQEGGWGGGMVWLDLAHDRDRWRDLVNAAVNLLD